MIRILFFWLVAIVLTSCSGGGPAYKFYVVVRPDDTDKFMQAATAFAQKNGLETATTKITSDTGDVLRVLEGRGHGLELWVQNTLMSGKEDPALCGKYSEPHSDPAQFTILTQATFLGSKAGALHLGERMSSELQSMGLDVRQSPAVCGAAVLGVQPTEVSAGSVGISE